jgi:hypothetical protein
MAYAKIRPRRGTDYEWSVYNTVLAEGEFAIQVPDTGIGTGLCKFKIGDGKTPWRELAYAFDGTAAAAIDGGGIEPTASIKIRSATSAEIAKAAQEDKVAQAYAASAKPVRYNPNDIYSLVDRNTGRIIPLSDAQAGGISPAQYYVATEMLRKKGYRGF